jgi:hypothetical protein
VEGVGEQRTKSKRIPFIFKDEINGSCICLRSLIYMSHVNKVQPITRKNDTHSSNTCDMYMSDLRHIHDPVLSSLMMEGIRLLYLFRRVYVYSLSELCLLVAVTDASFRYGR